jgi:hypothetical protein
MLRIDNRLAQRAAPFIENFHQPRELAGFRLTPLGGDSVRTALQLTRRKILDLREEGLK